MDLFQPVVQGSCELLRGFINLKRVGSIYDCLSQARSSLVRLTAAESSCSAEQLEEPFVIPHVLKNGPGRHPRNDHLFLVQDAHLSDGLILKSKERSFFLLLPLTRPLKSLALLREVPGGSVALPSKGPLMPATGSRLPPCDEQREDRKSATNQACLK